MKKLTLILGVFVLFARAVFIPGPVKAEEDKNSWEELINVKVVEQTDTADRIVVETTDEVKFHVFEVSNPPRLVLEMVGTVHNWGQEDMEVNGNLIKRIRSGQYKNDPVKITRVVLDMARKDFNYDQVTTKNQISISASLNQSDLEKKSAEKKEKEESKEEAAKKKEPEKETTETFSLEPNVPTEEHKEKISKIKNSKKKRAQMKQERLEKISEISEEVAKFDLEKTLGNEPVNFNFKDANILDILRSFEMKMDVNIIPAKNVSGEVTLRLNEVPFYDAFNILMDRMDLVALQPRPNVIRVMPKEDIPTQRETINLTNRKADDIKTTLSGLLSSEEQENTTIGVDAMSNALIVSAPSSVLNKIKVLTDQLDIKSPQIKIKARLIEVSAGDELLTDMTWASSVPMDMPEEYNADTGEYEKVPADAEKRLRAGRDLEPYGVDDDKNIDPSGVLESFGGSGGVIDFSAILDETQVYGLLNLLSSDEEAKTLSEPTIMTENNKQASIHVGQNLPVRTRQVTDTGTTEDIQFIQEGVNLQVTPMVSPGSEQISLLVNINVSELTGYEADNPVTTERTANTQITIESGKTVVIGGLIKESTSKSESGIPILKDIPLLGYLFKNTREEKSRRELLIFLSPELIIS
ncbi:MAG: secretin N-terminal domain-containing protein [Elusimicrobiota bacterium]